jgi:hypothetical protein
VSGTVPEDREQVIEMEKNLAEDGRWNGFETTASSYLERQVITASAV